MADLRYSLRCCATIADLRYSLRGGATMANLRYSLRGGATMARAPKNHGNRSISVKINKIDSCLFFTNKRVFRNLTEILKLD